MALVAALGTFAAFQISEDGTAEAHTVQTSLIAGNSGKCLAVYPGDPRNGAIAYQWTCGSQTNVQIEDAGDGWHYVRFLHSNKCLSVNGYAGWDGATLDQWDCVGQSNQKWSGSFNAGGFEIHTSQAYPLKCITVDQESRADGALVNQWQCVNQSNQAWFMAVAVPVATATPSPTSTPAATATPSPTSIPSPSPTP
jgi:hypothetical protein